MTMVATWGGLLVEAATREATLEASVWAVRAEGALVGRKAVAVTMGMASREGATQVVEELERAEEGSAARGSLVLVEVAVTARVMGAVTSERGMAARRATAAAAAADWAVEWAAVTAATVEAAPVAATALVVPATEVAAAAGVAPVARAEWAAAR